MGPCNTFNDLSNRVCVPNKTEDLNLSVFNMIIQYSMIKVIIELEKITKHIS